jgi:hypothetical protein
LTDYTEKQVSVGLLAKGMLTVLFALSFSAMGLVALPGDWTIGLRIAAGAAAGLFSGLCLLAIDPELSRNREVMGLTLSNYTLLLLAGFVVICACCGVLYLPGEWSLPRRIFAGVFGGILSCFCVSANRMLRV